MERKMSAKTSLRKRGISLLLSILMVMSAMPTVLPSALAADPTISMKEQTVTYTGEEIRFPNAGITIDGMSASDTVHYYYSNNISSGATPVFTENAYPTYCGRYRVYATITDKNGTKLADSGNATSFVIVPKSVTIEAATNEKPYDGTPLTDSTYILRSELGKGDTLGNVTVVGTQTPVGSSPNKITGATVLKGANDVTSNYSLTFVDGTLTVTEKTTTVTLKDKTAEYTASPIAIEPATVTGSSAAPVYHYYSDKDLKNEISGPPTDAGTYYVKAKVAADPQYGAGENDPAATLTITPYNATITADDATKTWDGTPLTSDQWHATGVLAGQEIKSVTVIGSQTDVGSSNNTPSNAKIVDANGKDVTKNYNITYTPGTLTVVEATPAIVVADKTVVYDGTEVASNAATVENVKVPWNPSELKYDYYGDDYQHLPAGELPKDAGVYRVVVTWTDPAGAYTLPDGTATITILKRGDPGPDPQNPLPEVTVTAPSAEKPYDGTPLTKNDPKDSAAVNLAPGHKISDKTVIKGTQTEVGESPNTFTSIVIEDANGNDVTKNYQFTPKGGTPGTLKVTPASPEITLKPKTETYNGQPIPIDPATVKTPGKGDPIDAKDIVYKYYKDSDCKTPVNANDPTTPPTDVGTYYVTATTPGSKNYASITSDPVELKINPVELTITTGSKTEPYAGKPLTYNECSYPADALVKGDDVDTINIKYTGKQEGVGTSKNTIDKDSVVIKNAAGTDVTKNYEITIIEGDLTLTKNTLTVTFDPQGGAPKPADEKVDYGEKATKPTDPTKPGYTFNGWLDPDDKPFDFDTPINSDKDLHADWKKNPTVTYDAQGGAPTPAPETVTYNTTATQPTSVPKRDGYTLKTDPITTKPIWFTDKECTKPFDFTRKITEDITLYAGWDKNPVVTFDPQGGTPKPDDQEVPYGGNATKPTTDPTKEGYTLKTDPATWYTDKECTKPFDFKTPITEDMTLYAGWNKNPVVTFDPEGGTPKPDNQEVPYAGTATKPTDPEKPGYTFGGWVDPKDPNKPFDFGTEITDDKELHATWTPNKHTVTYKADNGTADPYVPVETYDYGSKLKAPADPTYTGHTFKGWHLIDDNGKPSVLWNYDTYTMPDRDIVLIAQWDLDDVTVTFDPDNGDPTHPVVLKPGATIPEAQRPDDPTKPGYIFDGWKDPQGNPYNPDTPINKDETFTAQWAEAITVTFDAQGGTPTPDKQTIQKGKTATEPTIKMTNGAKEFVGWYTESACVNKFDFNTKLNVDTTLFAKWVDDAVHVTFESNGGTVVPSQTLAPGDKATRPADPTKSGNTFVDWYSDAALTTPYKFDTPVDKDITLYAKWTPTGGGTPPGGGTTPPTTPNHTLTFETNGGNKIDPIVKPEGTKVELSQTPTKQDFKFEGWYSDRDLTKPITSVTLDNDTTVYAKWSEVSPDKPVLEKDKHFAYIQGYPTGAFLPTKSMTRAEVVVMFSRLIKRGDGINGIDDNYGQASTFTDVPAGKWYTNAIGFMQQYGIVNGYKNGTFMPDSPITRAEFAAIASRFDNLTTGGSNNFKDVPSTHWAYDEINFAVAKGWVEGYSDGTFKPDQAIVRAEVITVTNRMLERSADQNYVDSNMSTLPRTYNDINKSYWAFYHIMEASNGHNYTKDTAGKETWTSTYK